MASLPAALSLRLRSQPPSWLRRSPAATMPIKCVSGPSAPPPKFDTEPESTARSLRSTWSISSSKLTAGLGALGFLETAYLTYLKLTDSEAFCPLSGGSCSDVLTSDYSNVFGIPLPLFGMAAYGLVSLLAWRQAGKNVLSGLGTGDVRVILLGTTTSMAAASAYFLYLLNTKFAGAPCSYCLLSAALSFSLFFITVKDFSLEEIWKLLGLQVAVAGLVVAALSNSYATVPPRSNEIELEPFETEITTTSTPLAMKLAEHLNSIGAKMYGAFWCTHCNEQKQMFGREASKLLDYVECFPNGVGKGKQIALECLLSGVKGFPTWIIDGKVVSGEQNLQDLAKASGFILEDSRPS